MLFILVIFIANCGQARLVESLCIMELIAIDDLTPDTIICWVNKEKGKGFTYQQMQQSVRFATDEPDMQKITDRLLECDKKDD